VPEETGPEPLLFLLASRVAGWPAVNRAPLIVIGLAIAISMLNDLLRHQVARAAATHVDGPMALSTAAPPNLQLWALIGMGILAAGGALASLAAAVCWFVLPEARNWLRPKLKWFASRPWPALRLIDLIAVFMVWLSALRVLYSNLLLGIELESGAITAWSMLVNGAALCLALSVGISLARQRAHGFHGSYGIWPFWRLAGGSQLRSIWQDIALGVIAYPLMMWVMGLALLVNQQFVRTIGREQDEHPLIRQLARPQPVWVLVVFFVMATLGAAFFEELLFRGMLYNTLRRYLGGATSALCAALLFALSHGIWSQVLGLFFLALVLTWLYDYTGRMVANMTLHLVNNLVSLVLALYAQQPGG